MDEAIALQKKAIEKGGSEDPEYVERLERYQKAKRDAGGEDGGKDGGKDADKDSGKHADKE